MQRNAVTLAALVLLGTPLAGRACEEPVFRWALLNEQADCYEAVVYHRGRLSPAEAALVEVLAGGGREGQPRANLVTRTVDLSAGEPAADEARPPEGAALPWVELRRPLGFDGGEQQVVWSGRLDAQAVGKVLDSPARRELARCLIGGQAVVWVLLESGTAARDEAAARLIQDELPKLEKHFADIRESDPSLPGGEGTAAGEELKLSFGLIRLRGDDPGEEVLLGTLRSMLPQAEAGVAKAPVAFPVFGRGRVLDALVGEDINADNLLAATGFLVGPCICSVRALHIGADLLLSANWDEATAGLTPGAPLTGLPEALTGTKTLPLPTAGAPLAGGASAPAGSSRSVFVSMLWAVGLIALAAGAAVVIVARRTSRS